MSKRNEITINTDVILKNQVYIDMIRKNLIDNSEKQYTRKYNITTYGCQMNEHDSEKLAAMLGQMGYVHTDSLEDAEMVIYNTCAVRENAELRVFGNMGWVKSLKEKNPNMILAVCGCMMQQKHIVDEIKNKYKFVDIVFGTHNLHNFPMILNEYFETHTRIIEVWDSEGEIIEGLDVNRKYELKAFVNTMFGCNNFCSYCIVPYTRGRERSREPQAILDEIKTLAAGGVKEITLLGQNVNSYGLTLNEEIDFSDLLIMASEIKGIERIKFMTSHPKDMSEKLIQTIARGGNIVPFVHLPVQSGSNSILKAMNRKYTREHYMDLVDKLKKAIPNVAISTDLIIGFPGETEEDIQQTLDLIRRVRFDSAFTYIYSRRVGTPAASMEDDVTDELKHQRFDRVLQLINEIAIESNQNHQGKVFEVLVEEKSKKEDNTYSGRTVYNSIVSIYSDEDIIGKTVKVKITRAKKFSLVGEVLYE